MERAGPSYSVTTLREYRSECGPDLELFFITGADAMLEIFAEEGVFGFITYRVMVFGPVIVLLRRVGRISKSGGFAAAELAAAALPLVFFCYGLFYINYLADDYFWAYMAFTIIVLKAPQQEGRLEARLPRIV